jgi:hypothetical protein
VHLGEALATPAKAARFRDLSAASQRSGPGVNQAPEMHRQFGALARAGRHL